MQTEEDAKSPKANLTALRLQALSGDNCADSAAPSVTDAGDQDDPSVLDVIGEIASGRVAKAEVPVQNLPLIALWPSARISVNVSIICG